MKSIQIRKAVASDLEELYELLKEFAVFIKTPEKLTITLEDMKKDASIFNCLLAVSENRIIGFATYFFAYYSWTGKSIYLDDLYVLPEYRGAGIGTKLMDTVIGIGNEEGCKKMRWQVSRWNKKAIEFYRRKGAVIDDVEINCDFLLNT
jgi:diamine N-acetyltransferase